MKLTGFLRLIELLSSLNIFFGQVELERTAEVWHPIQVLAVVLDYVIRHSSNPLEFPRRNQMNYLAISGIAWLATQFNRFDLIALI